jgi:hypothetical protein
VDVSRGDRRTLIEGEVDELRCGEGRRPGWPFEINDELQRLFRPEGVARRDGEQEAPAAGGVETDKHVVRQATGANRARPDVRVIVAQLQQHGGIGAACLDAQWQAQPPSRGAIPATDA